jgi:hypothetical protein
MDLEVRQAQRTLQRAGVEILTDAVSLEEFPFQYGNLLASWLETDHVFGVFGWRAEAQLEEWLQKPFSIKTEAS